MPFLMAIPLNTQALAFRTWKWTAIACGGLALIFAIAYLKKNASVDVAAPISSSATSSPPDPPVEVRPSATKKSPALAAVPKAQPVEPAPLKAKLADPNDIERRKENAKAFLSSTCSKLVEDKGTPLESTRYIRFEDDILISEYVNSNPELDTKNVIDKVALRDLNPNDIIFAEFDGGANLIIRTTDYKPAIDRTIYYRRGASEPVAGYDSYSVVIAHFKDSATAKAVKATLAELVAECGGTGHRFASPQEPRTEAMHGKEETMRFIRELLESQAKLNKNDILRSYRILFDGDSIVVREICESNTSTWFTEQSAILSSLSPTDVTWRSDDSGVELLLGATGGKYVVKRAEGDIKQGQFVVTSTNDPIFFLTIDYWRGSNEQAEQLKNALVHLIKLSGGQSGKFNEE